MVVEMMDGDGNEAGMATEAAVVQRIQTVNVEAAKIQSSAKAFAASGGKGFHIEPQAAATLINSCQKSLDELNKVQTKIINLQMPPQLGISPAARVVSPFTQKAALDSNGIYPAIQSLVKTLQDMIQAYKNASTNYAETEALVQQAMQQANSELA
ncbi:MAG TPA: hypothetical protein VHV74_26455 [Pseudonocardiaceae bacterium]|jgi:hypothetical protein|nr:hypothetical protein [Pseudonocardiaceae bacterium]